MNRLLQYAISRSRKVTDKAVMKVLLSERETPTESGKRAEALCWSGSPGFVATFNRGEFFTAVAATIVITIISVILFYRSPNPPTDLNSHYHIDRAPPMPPEDIALLTAIICSIILLFVGWVRQVCRYIKTVGMFYAVTDERVLIIKHRKVVDEMPVESVTSMAVSRKLFGNGTVVFNQGADYFEKNPLIEAPTRKVFVFFNVIDPYNVERIFESI